MITQEFQKNEILVFPPGGFNTFDEVCTALLAFPALMSEALDGWQLVLGCCCNCGDGTCGLVSCTWGLGFAVFLVVGAGGGASEPNEIELPPPGGRITLQRTRRTMHNKLCECNKVKCVFITHLDVGLSDSFNPWLYIPYDMVRRFNISLNGCSNNVQWTTTLYHSYRGANWCDLNIRSIRSLNRNVEIRWPYTRMK